MLSMKKLQHVQNLKYYAATNEYLATQENVDSMLSNEVSHTKEAWELKNHEKQ